MSTAAHTGWPAPVVGARDLEQLLVPLRPRLGGDLAIGAGKHRVERLARRARIEGHERQQLHGVVRGITVEQDAPLAEEQPEPALVDQRVLVGGDGAEVVLGGECVVHRGEAVERDLGARVEAGIGQERPPLAEDRVILDVAAEAGQRTCEAGVLGAPVLLERGVGEPFGPRGHADARDHDANLDEPSLLFNQPFGMYGSNVGCDSPERRSAFHGHP